MAEKKIEMNLSNIGFRKNYSTKINIIANLTGNFWMAALNIAAIPVYLQYLGIEAYGLIGLFGSIQAFIILLDFGLSPTLNREFARLSALEDQSQEMHHLKRTLEIPNWISALLIVSILTCLSPLLADFWIQNNQLSSKTVTQALIIMSVTVAIQFSSSFYVGGLLGLQKQVALNTINIIFSTLRIGGAVYVIAYVSAQIQAFLLWQCFVTILQAIALIYAVRRSLPAAAEKGRFQKETFYKVWKFAAGMTGITIVTLILTQTDKVILSRMLTLKEFGYYTLAGGISGVALGMPLSSINNAVYPRLSKYVSLDDTAALTEFYHRSCQLMSVVLISVAVILILFSFEILLMWTGKKEIADNTYLIMSLLTIGTLLNSLMWLPYHLQLAYGWTSLSFKLNVAAVLFLVPCMIASVYFYGVIGGVVCWIILNGFYILIGIQIMHRRLLKNEMLKWYFADLFLPFSGAIIVAGIAARFFVFSQIRFYIAVELAVISGLTLFSSAIFTKASRDLIRHWTENLIGYLPFGKQFKI